VTDRALTAFHSRPWLFAGLLSLVLLVANVVAQPDFASPSNWPSELATLAPLALVAFASTPAIVSGGGGLDLSMGPLAVLCNVVLVQELLPGSLHGALAGIVVLVALGAAVGAINGFLVAVLRYQPVLATLCMTFVITGINLKLGAIPIGAGNNWTQHLAGNIAGPIPGALVLILVPVAIWQLLSRTAFHRNLYGVGGNDVTAFSAGVNVPLTRIVAYATGGVFAAIGGIALTAVVQSSQADSTSYYILVALTAVALGGTSLFGGRGGLRGSFFGAAALYLMQNFLTAVSVSPNWLNVVYGLMLLVGVIAGARAALTRAALGTGSG
jgi:ribose transport system permease protein